MRQQKVQQAQTSWQQVQNFGDQMPIDKISEEDILTAISFDTTGKYLAIGDKSGRLIFFENSETKASKFPQFQYFTEIQSHVKEFDYLKSADIEEKINQLCWMKQIGNNLFIISTNDKTIKIWKISERTIKKPIKSNNKDLKLPKMEIVDQGYIPTLVKCYPNLHTYLINSISLADNQDFLISSDDLRVYLWSTQRPENAFSVIDLKPENIEDVSEVITCSKFHPVFDNQFIYSTSKGVTKLCDMRKSGICDTTGIVFAENVESSQKNFFTDIVSSISDAQFSNNGRYIYTRDFLTCKIWDIKMATKPVSIINIFDPLKSKLCELYENESIFDKFDLCSSPDSNIIITGNYNNQFHIFDRTTDQNFQFDLNFKKKTIAREIPKKFYENLPNNYDFNFKVLRTAYHPVQNYVALACLNSIFFYGKA